MFVFKIDTKISVTSCRKELVNKRPNRFCIIFVHIDETEHVLWLNTWMTSSKSLWSSNTSCPWCLHFSNLRQKSITTQFPSSILSWINLLMHFIKYLLIRIFTWQRKSTPASSVSNSEADILSIISVKLKTRQAPAVASLSLQSSLHVTKFLCPLEFHFTCSNPVALVSLNWKILLVVA